MIIFSVHVMIFSHQFCLPHPFKLNGRSIIKTFILYNIIFHPMFKGLPCTPICKMRRIQTISHLCFHECSCYLKHDSITSFVMSRMLVGPDGSTRFRNWPNILPIDPYFFLDILKIHILNRHTEFQLLIVTRPWHNKSGRFLYIRTDKERSKIDHNSLQTHFKNISSTYSVYNWVSFFDK